ncbi:hypothetical protein FH972_015161 [Carpinus fangiana]|uniref:Uncharacterized protein n=1 Tax=Carpinus fangiana TaxID=176857 RepID=A0A5N6RBU3_9ROSI|nr:hypothetical protein FH972_015161 [Carpinus fangiana]
MSMHGIPHKSPHKHPSPGNGQRVPKEVAKCVPELELQLVYILLDKANVGVKSLYDKKMLVEITILLNAYVSLHVFTSVQLTIKVLIFQEHNEKYSHFKGSGPLYDDLLCSIFVKTTATGEYGHASTITSPNSDEGNCGFDLNNVVPVVDLSDSDGAPAPNNSSKSKRKRKVSHSRSCDLCASKHESIEDKEVEALKI